MMRTVGVQPKFREQIRQEVGRKQKKKQLRTEPDDPEREQGSKQSRSTAKSVAGY